MTFNQLQEYDRFLDENDWDIYYWATQIEEPAESGASSSATSPAPEEDTPTETWKNTGAKSGEWAQTVGAFRAAHRPIPSRWKGSEIMTMLRKHVGDSRADGSPLKGQTAAARGGKNESGAGIGRMPNVQVFDS